MYFDIFSITREYSPIFKVANESLVLPKSKYGRNDQQTSIQYTEYNMALAICIVIYTRSSSRLFFKEAGWSIKPTGLP